MPSADVGKIREITQTRGRRRLDVGTKAVDVGVGMWLGVLVTEVDLMDVGRAG